MCGYRTKKVPTKMQVASVSNWHLNSKVSVKFPFSKAWMVAAGGWVHMHCPRPLCNSAPLAQLKHKPGLARPTVTYNNTLFSTNKESTAPRHLWPTSTTVHLSVSPPHQLLAPHTNFQLQPPPSTLYPPLSNLHLLPSTLHSRHSSLISLFYRVATFTSDPMGTLHCILSSRQEVPLSKYLTDQFCNVQSKEWVFPLQCVYI